MKHVAIQTQICIHNQFGGSVNAGHGGHVPHGGPLGISKVMGQIKQLVSKLEHALGNGGYQSGGAHSAHKPHGPSHGGGNAEIASVLKQIVHLLNQLVSMLGHGSGAGGYSKQGGTGHQINDMLGKIQQLLVKIGGSSHNSRGY